MRKKHPLEVRAVNDFFNFCFSVGEGRPADWFREQPFEEAGIDYGFFLIGVLTRAYRSPVFEVLYGDDGWHIRVKSVL